MKPDYAGVMSVIVNPTIRLVTSFSTEKGTEGRKGQRGQSVEGGKVGNSGSENHKTLTVRVDVNIQETSFSSDNNTLCNNIQKTSFSSDNEHFVQ